MGTDLNEDVRTHRSITAWRSSAITIGLVDVTALGSISAAAAPAGRNPNSSASWSACRRTSRAAVKVPAMLTVVAVLLGGALLGIVGALVAIAVAAALQLLVNEVLYPRLDET
jgi:TRAP-type C4-dicarboxylate transport system permease large subunit